MTPYDESGFRTGLKRRQLFGWGKGGGEVTETLVQNISSRFPLPTDSVTISKGLPIFILPWEQLS